MTDPRHPPTAHTRLEEEFNDRFGSGSTNTKTLSTSPEIKISGPSGNFITNKTTNYNTNTTNYADLHDACLTCGVPRHQRCEHMTPREAGSVSPSAAIGGNYGHTAQVPINMHGNPNPHFTRLDGARPSTSTLHDEIVPVPASGKGGLNISGPMGFPRTSIFLQPIAAPQGLGMAAWSATAFVFGAWLAEWYGTDATALSIFPFFILGGICQFAAGMWSFRSRDTLASVVHTMWASFWIAIGIYYATRPATVRILPNQPNTQPTRWTDLQNFAIWMVPIAAFTWIAAMASLLRDLSLTLILSTMATGSTLTLIGWFAPSTTVVKIGAYFWLFGSLLQLFRVFVFFIHENKNRRHDGYDNDDNKHGWLPRYHRREAHWRDDWRQGCTYPYREPGVVHGETWY
ncbi:hypothetical protein HDV00_007871 [Rhizophlyctis rosea]|nr:hypothetical protein HDV00_007871 [Rhizophlyctis rosea]